MYMNRLLLVSLFSFANIGNALSITIVYEPPITIAYQPPSLGESIGRGISNALEKWAEDIRKQQAYNRDLTAKRELMELAHQHKLQEMAYQQQLSNQAAERATEARLRSEYPDFENVVNHKNVEILRNNYPEIVQAVFNTEDLYSKAVFAYIQIKKLGIYKAPQQINQISTQLMTIIMLMLIIGILACYVIFKQTKRK